MSTEKILHKSILAILKPLVKILLRNNISFPAFNEMARKAYVEVAEEGFVVDGKKQTNSRISTITGLSRKEVKRLQDLPIEVTESHVLKYNRAARVVYGWVHDQRYQKNGQQLPLKFEGETPSFSQLVKQFSGDVPPRAILDELMRIGLVEKDEQGLFHLLKRAYIPKDGLNEKITYLGKDVSALINTMDRNIYQTDLAPFFQRKVYYDNLPEECIAELKQMISENSQALLEKVDQAMAKNDRDVNPSVEGTGKRAIGVSIYYFEDKPEQENSDEN